MERDLELRIRTPRLQLALGYIGAGMTAVLAGALVVWALGAEEAPAQRAVLLAGAALLALTCVLVIRRALVQASELRIGATGILVETLRWTRFVARRDVLRIELRGRRARVLFGSRGGADEAWVELPDAEALRQLRRLADRHGYTVLDPTEDAADPPAAPSASEPRG